MLDNKFVEGFTFKEFCYLSIGAVVFGLPWLLVPSFWERVFNLNLFSLIAAEIVIVVFLFALLFSLAYEKHPAKKALGISLSKLVVILVSTLTIAAAALVIFGLIGLDAAAGVFGKTILTTHIITAISAVAFDLLMSK